jgi:hypothetical protein
LAALVGAVLNPLFKHWVHRDGIKTTAAKAARLGGSRPLRPMSPQLIARAKHVTIGVHAASRVAPIHVVCLPRSLALWTVLRRLRIPADLRIGMDETQQDTDLAAHAWVEVDGHALGENRTHIASLHPFDEPILPIPTRSAR